MFGVDFSELMVILVVALIVIGPERLPKVARTCGHLLGRAQRYVNGVKADITREMEIEELQQMQKRINQEVMGAEKAVNQVTQTVDLQVLQLNSSVAQQVQQVDNAIVQPVTKAEKTPIA